MMIMTILLMLLDDQDDMVWYVVKREYTVVPKTGVSS